MAESTYPSYAEGLLSGWQPIHDALQTETSIAQDLTVQQCLPLLGNGLELPPVLPEIPGSASHSLPRLNRKDHIAFLHKTLGKLPRQMVVTDAIRPWMIYWALTGLYLLGEDVYQFRERVISTLATCQNSDGGFGGGSGQMSHSAPSYAAILSLVIVGGDEALNLIDRKALWQWLGRLKQRDGGFSLSVGGEVDVRGAYCSITMVVLLNLPLQLPPSSPARFSPQDTFFTGLPEYLSRCQTYEGGISGSPDTEAHGAYAFCALACLCLFGPPHEMLHKHLHLPSLISWLSARQYHAEGSFSGRTNKLVDGCYSHWVGGCWPLIGAALRGKHDFSGSKSHYTGDFYSREGLMKYILCCCQNQTGGLRDKPEKGPDGYHSCYVLAGLSSAQHEFDHSDEKSVNDARDSEGIVISAPTSAAFRWTVSHNTKARGKESLPSVEDDNNYLKPLHPLFVLPFEAVANARKHYEAKEGF